MACVGVLVRFYTVIPCVAMALFKVNLADTFFCSVFVATFCGAVSIHSVLYPWWFLDDGQV